MNYEERIAHARAFAIHKAPYFASVIHSFVFRPIPGFPSMFVTAGMVLGYGTEWAETAEIEELAADIAHETHHFLRNHFVFFGQFPPEDMELMNLAGDLAINPDLRNEGWKLAKSAVFPAHLGFPEGKTIMEYFDLLRKQRNQRKKNKKGGSGAGQKEGQDVGQSGEQRDLQPNETQGQSSGQGAGQDSGQGPSREPGVACGKCGSLAGGSAAPEMEKKLDEEVGRSEIEKLVIAKQAQQDIKDYVQAKGRGTVPGYLAEWAAVEEEPAKVSWRDELAAELRDCTGQMQSGGDDFSMSRPSKRSYVRGFIRPGLVEYEPVVAFILDSSASMGKRQLKDALVEAAHLFEQLGIGEMWFAEADADMAMEFEVVRPDFFRELEVKGRGGTDFRPALKAATKLYPKPDIVIYGTDGDGAAPANPPPDMHVVWCVVPNHYNRAPAKWGKAIFITDKKLPTKETREGPELDYEDYEP